MSYFSVIGRQRKLPVWENQRVLDVARTDVEGGYVGDGGEGRELEKKNMPMLEMWMKEGSLKRKTSLPSLTFFLHLCLCFLTLEKNSFNLRDKE